jgi:large subunit ribosomal protein L25
VVHRVLRRINVFIVGAIMATVSVNASSRTEIGKGAARKIRAQGLLPAVIYRAGQPATSVSIDPNELENAFRRTGNRNTLVDLGVDGKTFTCLVKDTQRDPVTANLIHVDFYEVDANEAVEVKVPVVPTGKAAGVVAGGKLRLIVRDLKVSCKPADIPASVDVDVTPLNVGDFIRVSTVTAPSGTEIIAPNDFNVLTVVGKRGARVEEAVDADDAEGADEGEGASEGGE